MDEDFDPLAAVRNPAGAAPNAQSALPPASPEDHDPLAAVRNVPTAAPSSPAPSVLGHESRLVGQRLASGALEGLATPSALGQIFSSYVLPHLPGAVQEFLSRPSRSLPPADSNPFGAVGDPRYSEAISSGEVGFPTPQQSNSLIARTGLDTEKPEGLGENLLSGAAKGAGAGLSLGALGPASLLSAVGGGAAGEAARSAGAGPLGQFVAGALPAILAGGAVGAVKDANRERIFNSTLQGLADHAGDSTTLQQAGETIQDAARSWLGTELPAKLSSAWSPVDLKIPPSAPAGLTNFRSTLAAINSSAGPLEPLAQLFKPRGPAQAGRALEDISEGTATWNDVKTLRSTLGDAMSNPRVIGDVGDKNLSRLYAALSEDMRSVAAQHEALPEFAAANAESSRLYDLAGGPVAKLVSGPKPSLQFDPKPESVANSLLSGGKIGDTTLGALADEGFPVGELLAGAHGEGKLPDLWRKLSPQAKSRLLPDPAMQEAANTAVGGLRDLRTQAKNAGDDKLLHLVGLAQKSLVGEGAGTLLGIGAALSEHINPELAAVYGAAGGAAGRSLVNGIIPAYKVVSKGLRSGGVLNPLLGGVAGAQGGGGTINELAP